MGTTQLFGNSRIVEGCELPPTSLRERFARPTATATSLGEGGFGRHSTLLVHNCRHCLKEKSYSNLLRCQKLPALRELSVHLTGGVNRNPSGEREEPLFSAFDARYPYTTVNTTHQKRRKRGQSSGQISPEDIYGEVKTVDNIWPIVCRRHPCVRQQTA